MERDIAIIFNGTKCFRPAKVAEMFGISVHTLRKWRRQGKGPLWTRLGDRIILYPENACWRYFVANGPRPQPLPRDPEPEPSSNLLSPHYQEP
jgi:Helix-turn-helix domain